MSSGGGDSEEPSAGALGSFRLVPWQKQLAIDKLPSGSSVVTNLLTREVYQLPGTEDWSIEIDDDGSATLFSYDEVADVPRILDAEMLFEKAVFVDASQNMFTADLRTASYFIV